MNKNITRFLTLISCLLFLPLVVVAQVITIDGINYTTSGNQATVVETYYMGDMVIPSFITVDGETYAVTSIGNYALLNCYGVTSVTIPSSVTNIGMDAFKGCPHLSRVYIEDLVAWCNLETGSYHSVPTCNYASLYLNGVEITDLVIPSSVSVIKSAAFCGCVGITSVTIPNTVKRIGYRAFENCIHLHRVNIEDLAAWCNIKFDWDATSNPANRGAGLYLNGVEIKDLVIPSTVTSIGENTFAGCNGLTSVTIPSSVTSIKNQAFYGCKNLESVYSLNPTPPICENSLFNGLSESATLYVPNESVEAYKSAEAWKDFQNIVGIDPTGIEDVKVTGESRKKENVVYDLSGRRLSQPKRGINIVNGKKVMMNL